MPVRSLRRRALASVLSAGLPFLGSCAAPREAPVDLLIVNARVHTVDAARPRAEAVAVREERIVWVGDRKGAERLRGSHTRTIDAGGRLLLPGFIDSHNHITSGSDPNVVTLGAAGSFRDLKAALRDFATAHPDLPWIEGEGWNYGALPGGRHPTAADLDGLTAGRPAFLVSYDSHTVWLNREALQRLGITRATTRLPYGEVEHDAKTGAPTGFLTGFATLGLSSEGQAALAGTLPSYAKARRRERLRRNLEAAASYGITTIVEPQAFLEDLPLFQAERESDSLKPRLQIALFHPRGTSQAEINRFAAARERFDDDRMRVAALKLYVDDVIEPHTAAMLEPYADAPATRGDTAYPPDEFAAVVTRLDASKFQLFIHAIGDRGIRTALDALARARAANGPRDARHQLVHVECLAPQDAPRFKALGVIACMQPRHCAPEIAARWGEAVGAPRWDHAWAFRTLKQAGATLAFSSDWNVAEMEPVIGIYSALTRAGLDGRPPGPWGHGQTVDVETAIGAYTLQGAFANFLDGDRGSISVGKYADLIVLSENLLEIPAAAVAGTRVLLTVVGGQEIYRDPAFTR